MAEMKIGDTLLSLVEKFRQKIDENGTVPVTRVRECETTNEPKRSCNGALRFVTEKGINGPKCDCLPIEKQLAVS
jgi:hypothetical protein